MARSKRRKPFPQYDRPTPASPKESFVADEAIGGIFGFFRDFGTRETIESIIIAVVLALMFRAFEAEAFIIPTGSMAPSLQGEHKDLECENCGYRYRAGASQESAYDEATGRSPMVRSTFCPICQYQTKIRKNVADHSTNSGDRILVNKFVYDFSQPNRYDVIVFKNPNNGKQNYIKRLIGLPGDNILIENGDIYLLSKNANGGWDRVISRKPPQKLHHILQTVDDTEFIGSKLKAVDWPLRWSEFGRGQGWDRVDRNGNPGYISQDVANPSWLRYRHYRPYKHEWPTIEEGNLPTRFRQAELPAGRLIGDQYAYNDETDSHSNSVVDYQDLGLHWVGDIGLECWANVESATGKLLLDVVEGGAHFVCEIDVATGEARLNCDRESVKFQSSTGQVVDSPVAKTNLNGTGQYHIEYVNADDRIHLWINGKLQKFDAAEYVRNEIAIPQYSVKDPGDAEPVGIAAENLIVRLTRLKVVRDIYYTSVRGDIKYPVYPIRDVSNLDDETEEVDVNYLLELYESPESWSLPRAVAHFKKKKGQPDPMFQLRKGATPDQDQFLPMGDNSPQSLDGRVWDGPHYVERDMLIGRALLIYWPHTLNEPIKFFPNFGRMGFIR